VKSLLLLRAQHGQGLNLGSNDLEASTLATVFAVPIHIHKVIYAMVTYPHPSMVMVISQPMFFLFL